MIQGEISKDVKYSLLRGEKLEPHNLEVPGSSPGWSTLKIKQLRKFVAAFFFICVNNA